jgi:hypothetical protein
MRLLPIGVLSLALGGAGGLAARESPVPTLASASASFEEGHLCTGADYPLDVELRPVAVRQVAGRDVLDLDLGVGSGVGRPLSVAYALEVVNDRGEAVEAPRRSARVELKNPGARHALRASTPAGLPDGFYAVRVSVAGVSGDEELSEYRHVYFEVRNGKTTPIDHDRWMTHSNAGQMRSAR